MPDTTVIKLKIRRGTDVQRQSVILEDGELGYTTDTKRIFVGDGATLGGTVVGIKTFKPFTSYYSLSDTNAQIGDIAVAQSLMYQLTSSDWKSLSSWAFIGTKPDNTSLEYTLDAYGNKVLSLKAGYVSNNSFASTAAYSQGGIIATVSDGLSANVDGRYVVLSSNYLTITPISADKISPTMLGNGLSGGNGTPISVNYNLTTFKLDTDGRIEINALPANFVTVDSVNTASLIGDKLQIDATNKIAVNTASLAGSGLYASFDGTLSIDPESLVLPASGLGVDDEGRLFVKMPGILGDSMTTDEFGRIDVDLPGGDGSTITLNLTTNNYELQEIVSPVDLTFGYAPMFNQFGQLSGYRTYLNTLSARSSTSSFLSVFNGGNSIGSNTPFTNQTMLTVISSYEDEYLSIQTRSIVLTSAGFITLLPTPDIYGETLNLAIPVFAYPT